MVEHGAIDLCHMVDGPVSIVQVATWFGIAAVLAGLGGWFLGRASGFVRLPAGILLGAALLLCVSLTFNISNRRTLSTEGSCTPFEQAVSVGVLIGLNVMVAGAAILQWFRRKPAA